MHHEGENKQCVPGLVYVLVFVYVGRHFLSNLALFLGYDKFNS